MSTEGVTRKRRSEAETRRLVAEAVIAHVDQQGISVVPEFAMEEVLAAAGVSRASAYRIWPGREAFTAFAAEQCAQVHAVVTLTPLRAAELAAEADAASADRLSAAAQFVAAAAGEELELMLASPRWRAFVRLQAVGAQADDDQLRGLLRRTRAQDRERLQLLHELVARAWGLLPITPDAISVLVGAAMLLQRATVTEVLAAGEPGSAAGTEQQVRDYRESLAVLVRGSYRLGPAAETDPGAVFGALGDQR